MYNTKKKPKHFTFTDALARLFNDSIHTYFQKGVINTGNSGEKKYPSLLCMRRHVRAESPLDCAVGKMKNHILLNTGLHGYYQNRSSSENVRRILWYGIKSDYHNYLLVVVL